VAVFVDTSDGPGLVGVIAQGDKQCAFFSRGSLHVATPVRDPDEPNSRWRRTRVVAYSVGPEGLHLNTEVVLTSKHYQRAYKADLARHYGKGRIWCQIPHSGDG
jgi:hypothetical protein